MYNFFYAQLAKGEADNHTGSRTFAYQWDWRGIRV